MDADARWPRPSEFIRASDTAIHAIRGSSNGACVLAVVILLDFQSSIQEHVAVLASGLVPA